MQLKLRRMVGIAAIVCLLMLTCVPATGLMQPEPEAAVDAVPAAGPEDTAALPEDGDAAPFEILSWDLINEPACTYRLCAEISEPDIAEADVLLWMADDPADVERFNAAVSATQLTADIDISVFHYLPGTYCAQIVGRNGAGQVNATSDAIEFTLEPAAAELTVRLADPMGMRYLLSLSCGELAGLPDVWFEAENAQSGASARVEAAWTGNAYSAVLPIDGLGSAGGFEITACMGHFGECAQELASAALEVPALAHTGLSLHADSSSGLFSYSLHAQSPLGIESARVAVWSDPDQADLRWVDMAAADDGSFICPQQSVRDYSGFGTYWAHAYVRLRDGTDVLASGLETAIVPRNCITVKNTARGRYDISVEGPSPAHDLKVAVWSEQDGQDDLIWYPASLSGSVWSAAVLASSHASGGTWIAHVYSGETLLGGITFTVPDWALLSEAEQRIADGCQKVYDAVGTDLHRNYLWVVQNLSYVRRQGHLSPPSGYTREQWYAVEGLEKQTGNCYTYAATFCELACGLGYDATYVEGAVWGVGQQWWPHGFVLINMDGSTYICDPELQYASSTGRNLYMQPISSPRATYRW